jgi:hypothetical protein
MLLGNCAVNMIFPISIPGLGILSDSMPNPNAPNMPEYPYSFEPRATFKLTEFGRKVLQACDESLLERIRAHSECNPSAVEEYLASRIGPDDTVTMSEWEFHNTLGPFTLMGPDTEPVIAHEVMPEPPRQIGYF